MRRFYQYLSALLVGSIFVGCVEKSGPENNPNVWQQGDTPYYVNLRLKTQSDTFTRAGDDDRLTDGEHFEHDIDKNAGNFALFFDGDGKYISYADLYSVNEEPNDTEAADEGGKKHGHEDAPVPVEATYSCRFYGFANRQPELVLVVVNAPQKIYDRITDFPGWTVSEVMKQVWDESGEPYGTIGFHTVGTGDEEKRYFTMTNTTYIDGDGKLHCAESIPEGSITTDESKVNSLAPVTIYLERMVSKFSMSLSFAPNEYHPVSSQSLDICKYEDGELIYYEYPWALQLLAWGLNGLETQNYLFKNVEETGDWLSHKGWNSLADRRCFWSVDPHYYKDNTQSVVYPWQYDNAMNKYDIDHVTWYEHFQSYDDGDRTFALKYYPFTHFCSDVEADGTMKNDKTDPGYDYWNHTSTFYTPENTFVPGMQVDRTRGTRAYELAGTHVLLCARLLIDPTGGVQYQPYDKIYRNRVGVCYIDDLSLLEDFMNAMNDKLTAQRYIYYKYYPWSADDVKKPEKYFGHTFRAVSSGAYALYYQNPVDRKYYELTSGILNTLMKDPHYRFVRPADAVNADGKIIPWVMYNPAGDEDDDHFTPLPLYILSKTTDAGPEGDIIDANVDILDRELKFEYFNEDNDEWTPFKAGFEDENDIQSLFFEIWGVADYFRNGLMYYAVPIYAQESTGAPASGDKKILDDTSAGFDDPKFYYYYGVVRNNWYNFTLHSIGDLGIPVFDVDKPIVPNYTDKKDQVKVEMEILSMHVEDITVPIS